MGHHLARGGGYRFRRFLGMAEKGTNYSLEHFELVTFPFGLQLQNYGWGAKGAQRAEVDDYQISQNAQWQCYGREGHFHAWVSDTNTNKQRALDPIFIGGMNGGNWWFTL